MLGGFNISDIVSGTIILLCIIWGAKRGLVKSVLGLGSIIISIVLALVLYQPVSDFLESSVIGEYVTINVARALEGTESTSSSENVEENADGLNLPGELIGVVTEGIDSVKTSAIGALSVSVSQLAINLISMLAVFLIVKLIMWIVTMLLDTISRAPVISMVNKLLGGAFGLISGVLTLYVLLAVLTFVTAVNTENPIVKNVLKSQYASKMYNDNFIVNFITDSGE